MTNITEIEARWLKIDPTSLKQRLLQLGATDEGEALFHEEVRRNPNWPDYRGQFVRIRTKPTGVHVSYKHFKSDTVDGTEEIEFIASNATMAGLFCDRLGATLDREQEKRVHTFQLDDVTVGLDTWPNASTYVELEGPSETAIRLAAQQLDLDWNGAVFENALKVLEDHFHIPVSTYRHYTFDHIA